MLKASLLVCALMAAAPSCPDLYSIGTHGFSVPSVDATTANAAPDSRGLGLVIQLATQNDNPYPLELDGIDYDVSILGSPVFSGTQGAVSVTEHSSATVPLPGVVDTSSPVLKQLHAGQSAIYTMTGTLRVKTPAGVRVDVAFQTSGAFVVPPGAPVGATR